MKPAHTYAGFSTIDLTEGRVHRVTDPDGSVRYVAYFPKTWEARPTMPVLAVNGETFFWQPYTVTEWEEVTLATIPAPTVEPEKTE